ncbi:MAG: hypothetical protein JSV25_08335, partial [Spirochaetota bacterium]
IDYFLWQYFHTPMKTVVIGAFLKERLIGSLGLQCRSLNNGLAGWQAVDVIVDEVYRKQGVFTSLAKFAFDHYSDEMDFGFILPNEAGRIAVERSLGWKNVDLIKTLSLDQKQDDFPLISRAEFIDDLCSMSMENKKIADNRVYFLRDKDCMRWRFGKNPEYNYFVIKIKDSFSVGKIFTDPDSGRRFGDIVDYGCVDSVDLMTEVFYATILYFQERGINNITTWAFPETSVYSILRNVGFIESMQTRFFCLKAFKSELHYLYDLSNWLLVEADSEVY